MDVRDVGPAVVIEADLPGILREDISIRFDRGRLTLEGRRRRPTAAARDGGAPAPDAANGDASPVTTGEKSGAITPDVREDVRPDVSPDVRWAHRERFVGSFRRVFRVPDTVDPNRISAESRDACSPSRCPSGITRFRVRSRSRSTETLTPRLGAVAWRGGPAVDALTGVRPSVLTARRNPAPGSLPRTMRGNGTRSLR